MAFTTLKQNVRRKVSRLKESLPARSHSPDPANALILMYHRVAEADSDPWSLCVSPQNFAEQLAVLKAHTHPLPLKTLNQKLCDHRPISRSVVITFDDGYADNLLNAKPLLEQQDIPATVFVTTGGIGHPQEFWWDELDRLLLQPGELPQRLHLIIAHEAFEWTLEETAIYSQADFRRQRQWRIENEDEIDPTSRHALYRALYEKFQPLSTAERQDILSEIRDWAKLEPMGRASHRSLIASEVAELDAGSLIDIGAHTVTHPFLSGLPVSVQQQEIQKSKDGLEQMLNRRVTSFSYPNGSYAPNTVSLVKKAGFDYACCSVPAAVKPSSNRFLLPRVVVEDWSGETFSRWLSGVVKT